MRNLSVTTFIHILFSVAILILVATFLLFFSWDKDRRKIDEYKRYQLLSLTFLSKLQLNPAQEALDTLYKELHVKNVPTDLKTTTKEEIELRGETLFTGCVPLAEIQSQIVGLIQNLRNQSLPFKGCS